MFSEKIVLVTGASSGIGLAQVQMFLEHGATVYGVDSNMASIEHERYTHYQCDVAREEQVATLPSNVDILCNTAGVLDGYTKQDATSLALWRRILDVNVTSMFLLVAHVLPHMLHQQSGIIVNMASIAGTLAGGGGVAYTASKHAVIGYTKQLALDYANQGIRVNAIAPGAIRTAMTQSDFDGDGQLAKWVAEQTPMKRWGESSEVAQATQFLAGDQSRFITGQVLVVDGGWSIQ